MSFREKPLLGQRINTALPLARGLISGLPFNESGGGSVFDSTRKKWYSLENNASFVAEGIEFDATTEHIKAFNGAVLEGEGTLVFRYKYTNTPASFYYFFALDDDYQEFSLYKDPGSSTTVTFNINDFSTSFLGSGMGEGSWIFDGKFHDVLVTWSDINNYRALFVDGKLFASSSDTFSWDAAGMAAHDLRIGGRYTGANRFAGGIYKYFYVWNRVLTLSEIQALYINPYAMFEDPFPIELFGYVAAGEGLSIPVAMLQMNQFNGGSI